MAENITVFLNSTAGSGSGGTLEVSLEDYSADGDQARDVTFFDDGDWTRGGTHVELLISGNGNGNGNGDGERDIFRFDLAGFDEDFAITLKSEDALDRFILWGHESVSVSDGVYSLSFRGTDGALHTTTLDPGPASVQIGPMAADDMATIEEAPPVTVDAAAAAVPLAAINLAPAADDDAFTVDETEGAGDVDFDALANDTVLLGEITAVNGDALNVGTAVAGSNGGTFTINANGSVDFDAGGDFEALGVGQSTTTSATYTLSELTAFVAGTQTTQTTAAVGTSSQDVFFDTTTAELTADGTIPISGKILMTNLAQPKLNVLIVMDESGSTTDNFSGTAPGDQNGDGDGNDIIDAQIAALIDVRQSINALGFGDANVDMGLVTFASNAFVLTTSGTALSSEQGTDLSAQSIVFKPSSNALDTVLSGRLPNGNTDFDDALDAAVAWMRSSGAGSNELNVIYFLSDGTPNTGGTDYAEELGVLASEFNAKIVGIGVGSSASLTELNKIDNTGGAELAGTPIELETVLLGNPLVSADAVDFRLFVNGVQDTSIDLSDLTQTLLGYTINAQTISGLNTTPNFVNEIRTEIEFDDGSVLTNNQAVHARAAIEDSATVTVTVEGVNDDPVAVDDAETTDEDTAVIVSVLGNDGDVDGDTLSVSGTTDPSNGSITVNGDGTITYTPDADFNGADAFTYTVSDGNGGSDTATVTVTVTPVNDDPVAVDDAETTDEDTAVIVSVLGNDGDVDGDTLSVSGTTDPANGSITVNGDGTITYTPDADFNGADAFTYTVSDGNGGTDTATVTVTVTPVNDDPVAVDDAETTDEDTAVIVSVLGNDGDVDGDTLSVSGTTDPSNGSITVNGDGTITYTPDADFNGADAFTYTVSDGNGGSDTATVNVTVTPVNDDPVAVDDAETTDEDTAVIVSVLGNDGDVDGDTLSVSGTTDPSNGSITVNGDGTITYTPDADFNGADAFTYTVSDGNGGSDTATVTVTVTPVNDDPVAVDDAETTDEDTAVIVSVLGNDGDIDGDTLSVSGTTDPSNGSITVNGDGTITYTPDADFNGADAFTYTVSDGNGGSDTATVNITVTPVNDDPVAVDDVANTASDSTVDLVLTANDGDVDGDDLVIDSIDTTGLLGTVTILDDNTVRYDPDGAFDTLGQGDSATETFTYTVSDGNGGTATATARVTVGGLNDDPVAVDDTASTGQATSVIVDLLGNDGDPNGDALTITSNTDPLNGSLVFNGDGTVTYDPDDTFFGTDSFEYTVSDGRGGTDTATATIEVARNFAPSIPEPVVFFAFENQTRAANLQAFDPEGDAVSYSIVGGADAGLFTIDATTGVMDFLTAPDFEAPSDSNGDNRYQVRVGLADSLNSVSQLVTVNVRDVDDTPNRVPVITNNGSADMSLALLINARGKILDIDAEDLDGDTLEYRLFGEDASKFSLDLNTGELSLPTPLTNPRGSFDGDFIYELDVLVTDGNGGQATIGIDYILFTAG